MTSRPTHAQQATGHTHTQRTTKARYRSGIRGTLRRRDPFASGFARRRSGVRAPYPPSPLGERGSEARRPEALEARAQHTPNRGAKPPARRGPLAWLLELALDHVAWLDSEVFGDPPPREPRRPSRAFGIGWVVGLALVALALLVSSAAAAPTVTTPGAPADYRPAVASWYGPGFYGNTTACGQTYDETHRGVAHKTLPCGTLLDIRHGGRVARRVPVTDRGPFTPGREFDLSAAVRAELGVSGVVTVAVRPHRPRKPRPRIVQEVRRVGNLAFARAETKRARARLERMGFDAPAVPVIGSLWGPGHPCGWAYACAGVGPAGRRQIHYAPEVFETGRVVVLRWRVVGRKRRLVFRRAWPSCFLRQVAYHELLHHATDFGVFFHDPESGDTTYRTQTWTAKQEAENHRAVDHTSRYFAARERRAGRCKGPTRVVLGTAKPTRHPTTAAAWLKLSDEARGWS